jgi:hypothetical protein
VGVTGVYFLVDYFGWETTYTLDPDRVTRLCIPLVLVGAILAANLGFWLSNALIQQGRERVGRLIYALIWSSALRKVPSARAPGMEPHIVCQGSACTEASCRYGSQSARGLGDLGRCW